RRRLADGHRPGEADDEGDARGLWLAEEPAGLAVEVFVQPDAQADELHERDVDLLDLLEVALLAQTPDAPDLLGRQRRGSVAGEIRPVGAFQRHVRRQVT